MAPEPDARDGARTPAPGTAASRAPTVRDRLASAFQRLMQVLAILALAGICLVILHKGYSDVTALARANSGDAFFPALLRYLFRNLAGG